jgi:hypothetical protein
MLESITRHGQYNHYSKRSIQGTKGPRVDVRSVFMFSATVILLIASSLRSDAEDGQKTSAELGQSGQSETTQRNQAEEKKATKPKSKCMPKQPCPDTHSPQ